MRCDRDFVGDFAAFEDSQEASARKTTNPDSPFRVKADSIRCVLTRSGSFALAEHLSIFV